MKITMPRSRLAPAVFLMLALGLAACNEAGVVGPEDESALEIQGSEALARSGPNGASDKGNRPDKGAMRFVADLKPLNDSGVEGTAQFLVQNGQFKARVHATGLTPNLPHPQHIHGFVDGSDATCPTEDSQDQIPGLPEEAINPDELIAVEEGADEYGPVLVPLDSDLTALAAGSFPVANPAGVVNYVEKTSLDALTIFEDAPLLLEKRHVVLHGMFVMGGEGQEYVATLPVACGTIEAVN